jgi:hypothetical protein
MSLGASRAGSLVGLRARPSEEKAGSVMPRPFHARTVASARLFTSYVRILMTTYMPVAASSAVDPKGLTRMVNSWFAAALLGTWRL